MYKINGEAIRNVEVYLDFAKSMMRMPNDEKLEKNAPRIYVEGLNKKGDKMSIMIETFVSDNELRALKVNEKLNLDAFLSSSENKEIDSRKYITDIILFTNRNFETAQWLNEYENIKVIIKKTSESILNITAYIEEFNLEYDVEIIIPEID